MNTKEFYHFKKLRNILNIINILLNKERKKNIDNRSR